MKAIKENQRSIRRHHAKRVAQARKTHYGGVYGTVPYLPLGKLVNTSCVCSCHVCANPRKLHGNSSKAKTIAELSLEGFLKKEA